MDPVNLHEFELAARERLPAMALDYYAGGAGDEITLRENRAALERIFLRPHVLRDVSRRAMRTRVLGAEIAMPVLAAPMAFQRLACAEGELATARAARAAGTVMSLSTFATSAVEDVVAAGSPSPVWFQLYVFRDRGVTKALVERAQAAGCTALVVTVDAPSLGRRDRDERNAFRLPDGLRIENLVGLTKDDLASRDAGSGLATYFLHQVDPALDASTVEWLRGITKLPIVVKGVLRGDDASRAVDAGAAGVIVSNHGGRQLDGAVASIDALPDVVDAVGTRAEVLVDGGFRRGVDVVKALAVGARAVLVGRPLLWGLAVDGERGARRVLELLASEIDLAMALCGCSEVGDIGRDLL
jgi:4-hydroxymandelate oxidase